MKSYEQYKAEKALRPPNTCRMCGCHIPKRGYWETGFLTMTWYGKDKYDDYDFVYRNWTGVHTNVNFNVICEECFSTVLKAIDERRKSNAAHE